MNIDLLRKAHPLIGELITAYDSFEKQHPDLSLQEWENVVMARIATLNEKLRSLGIVAAVHRPNAFLRDVFHPPFPETGTNTTHPSLGTTTTLASENTHAKS